MSTDSKQCPNCDGLVGHEENGCVLATLITVLRGRGGHKPEQLRRLWADCDVNALWGDISPLVSKLGEGGYNERE